MTTAAVLTTECQVDRVGDRTLVEAVVTNETTVDRRVRVENRLDGRVEPPRENGVPTPGWDDDGYTGVVPADDRLTLGYACAAPPTDPPVTVRDEGRAVEEDEATAADAVRLLDDHAPPADAVPVDGAEPDVDAATNGEADDPPAPVAAMVDRLDGGDETNGPTVSGGTTGDGAAVEHGEGTSEAPTEGADEPSTDPATDAPDDHLPPAVASWFAAVRGRVDDAEALADGDLAAAARVIEERGDAAAALSEELAADERALRALATAAETLADRAAAAEVPADALRRLS